MLQEVLALSSAPPQAQLAAVPSALVMSQVPTPQQQVEAKPAQSDPYTLAPEAPDVVESQVPYSPTATTIPAVFETQHDSTGGASDSDVEIVGSEIPAPLGCDELWCSGALIPSAPAQEKAVVVEPREASHMDQFIPDTQPGLAQSTPPPTHSLNKAVATSPDGTMHQQEPSEPFDGLWDEIPELADGLAPKPTLGTHHISPEAIRSRSRRIFEKRADGSKKVSDQIWNDWKAKGPKKKLLEDIFRQVGYDPELWDVIWYAFYVCLGNGNPG